MKKVLLSLPIILFLAACNAPAPVTYAPIRFDDRSKIYLDVASINVQNESEPKLSAPYVGHLSPVTPELAMQNLVNDRLKASGRNKNLVALIKKAEIIEEKLPVTQGFEDLFKNEQEAKYTATAVLELRIYGDRAVSLASTEIRANRFMTLAENASLQERDAMLYNLTRALTEDLNAEMDKNIQQYFANFVHYSR